MTTFNLIVPKGWLGISSNLNLITDKGTIYSFTLQDISGAGADHTPPLLPSQQKSSQRVGQRG